MPGWAFSILKMRIRRRVMKSNAGFVRWMRAALLALPALFVLAGCGGSGTIVAGGGTGGTGISTGVMTKGSVNVNGVRFEDSLAQITIDDTPKLPADLQDGMVVKVRGTFNDDGLTGNAEKIEAENEVQGKIASKGPEADAFTVLGVKIFVDGGTVYSNVPGSSIAGLSVDDPVEVHGLRDSANSLRATRVELLAGARALEPDELKGTLSGLNPTDNTFLLGTQLVNYTGATIRPPGALANGILVEVHGFLSGGTFVATIVDLEDLEDDDFDPAEGEEVEVEGFVSGFSAHPGMFFVSGAMVQTTASTRFEGGISDDLANDARVEAEGHMSGALLIVEKIQFKESVRIESNATGSTANSVTLLGKTVLLTSKTDTSGLTGGLTGGLKVRGFLNLDGVTITAARIDSLSNPVDPDRQILQGPVASFNATARTLVIVGINVNASSVSANDVKNANDQVITIDQFFALLTANRSIVKARGTFAAGTITANQIEIE
jgi:hypothetical protein